MSDAAHTTLLRDRLGVASRGEALAASVRAPFERGFARSFEHVRVHRDGTAASAAASLGARAFTLGRHIVFGERAYAPFTSAGKHLLAHELTHVAQHDANGHAASGGAAMIHRVVDWPDILPPIPRLSPCFRGLYTEMVGATAEFVRGKCERGATRVPSNHYDAFGHCWIACEGSRRCGRGPTWAAGVGRELLREYTPLGGPHDSYEQDLRNQERGRALSESPLTCATACDRALQRGTLDLSAPAPDCFDCASDSYQIPCGS